MEREITGEEKQPAEMGSTAIVESNHGQILEVVRYVNPFAEDFVIEQ